MALPHPNDFTIGPDGRPILNGNGDGAGFFFDVSKPQNGKQTLLEAAINDFHEDMKSKDPPKITLDYLNRLVEGLPFGDVIVVMQEVKTFQAEKKQKEEEEAAFKAWLAYWRKAKERQQEEEAELFAPLTAEIDAGIRQALGLP